MTGTNNTQRDLITNVQETNEVRELPIAELEAVSGGLTRAQAVLEAYKVLAAIELDEIDVEPVVHVPMKL